MFCITQTCFALRTLTHVTRFYARVCNYQRPWQPLCPLKWAKSENFAERSLARSLWCSWCCGTDSGRWFVAKCDCRWRDWVRSSWCSMPDFEWTLLARWCTTCCSKSEKWRDGPKRRGLLRPMTGDDGDGDIARSRSWSAYQIGTVVAFWWRLWDSFRRRLALNRSHYWLGRFGQCFAKRPLCRTCSDLTLVLAFVFLKNKRRNQTLSYIASFWKSITRFRSS